MGGPRKPKLPGNMQWCSGCSLALNYNKFSSKKVSYCISCMKAANNRTKRDKERRNTVAKIAYWKYREKEKARAKVKYIKTKPEKLEKERKRRLERRYKLIDLYGGFCECCKEDRKEFLAIDHVYGGGIADAKAHGSQNALNNWLLVEKREGYRVLCHNCNMSLGLYKYCPHGGLL